jgi:hypothetical protein
MADDARILYGVELHGQPTMHRVIAEMPDGTFAVGRMPVDAGKPRGDKMTADFTVTLNGARDLALLAMSGDPAIRGDKDAGRKMAAALLATLLTIEGAR